jgi:hypothetical protein
MGEAKKIKEQLYKAGSPYLRGDLPEENWFKITTVR